MIRQKHIINKQILEIQLPITTNVFEEQQKLSTLYREKWIPIIDTLLTTSFGGTQQKSLQIDTLTIDLGVLEMKDLTTVFEEKLKEELAAVVISQSVTEVEAEKISETKKTPLRILGYFLKTSLLPWWATASSKVFLQEQVAVLIQTRETGFIKMLSQLHLNTVYLERFLLTCTAEQILECLQLLTDISLHNLELVKQEGLKEVKEQLAKKKKTGNNSKIEITFWKTVFHQILLVENYESLLKESVAQTLLALGIHSTKEHTENPNKNRHQIQVLIEKQRNEHLDNSVWQQFFSQLAVFALSSSFLQVPSHLLKTFEKLLVNLDLEQNKNKQELALAKTSLEKSSASLTETLLLPIAQHVQLIQKTIQKLQPEAKPMVIEQLQSSFEDTDFITVQNAGLVLLWPFLPRFFENLELLNQKEFKDVFAKNKAACLLQYIVEEDEESLFEGLLPLNKVLCGIPLSDTVPVEPLKEDEKAIIDGLLQAVMQRGPHWKNLSIAGFRASYLQREGLLRSRDGHWLLQVKKETYDITLEKLPWSFNTIKLPWMNEIILVEWM
ncbi:hypothetical protein FIA58_000175 [Flavobacterium jejuense]|uniref:Uncharacterized protein n=1 Tax=Flavobacterium jejuense TaxID=1544455 RepID=A0ABX0IKG4_9FLAO|nr:contractile injection system tape measure protein [Flavobacterium jejuense]NHN24078.1 hypothetical protein [Flavobacterium jejuense]